MPYRQQVPAAGATMDRAAIVADVEKLIAVLRALYDAESSCRGPREAELRLAARRAVVEHPLTRDRREHWLELIDRRGSDEVIDYLQKQIIVPKHETIPTRGELFHLAAILPLLGVGCFLVVASLIAGERRQALALVPIAVVQVGYLVLWSVPRLTMERSVQLGEHEVWFSATGWMLRGRRVRYEDIASVERYGHDNRRLRVVFRGGTVRYTFHMLDVALLARELEHRRQAVGRWEALYRRFAGDVHRDSST